MALHSPHLRLQLGVSCPDHTGLGRPTRTALLRVLYLLIRQAPLAQRPGIKDPHLAPALLILCGSQRTHQLDVLQQGHQSLLQASMS